MFVCLSYTILRSLISCLSFAHHSLILDLLCIHSFSAICVFFHSPNLGSFTLDNVTVNRINAITGNVNGSVAEADAKDEHLIDKVGRMLFTGEDL